MRLYKQIIYRLDKKRDTPQMVIARIEEAFLVAGFHPHDIKFFISESILGISGIDRLLKQNPTLAQFRHTVEVSQGREQRLSNLTARWAGANPNGCTASLRMEDTLEIIRGIPRRYPVHNATFVFDRLPMLSRIPDANKLTPVPFLARGDVQYTRLFAPNIIAWSDYPSPCIRLQSDWWISGRTNFLDAIVELEDVGERIPQLELNEDERRFLETIGEIYHERVFVVPSNGDESAVIFENMVAGDRIVQSCYESGSLAGVVFPYQLKPLAIGDYPTEPLSVKKAINQFFNKRGFSYNTKFSGNGIFTITRLTKNNHLVKLIFDRGKFSADVSCVGSIEGPLWKHEFKLPAAASHMMPYRVTRQIDIVHQIGNIAAAYDAIEMRIIDAIDDLYGSGPAWLTFL